ncbi:MAG: SAF domain-containing protein [bacterium]|nr:SAF domain-containing protein [bacterium]
MNSNHANDKSLEEKIERLLKARAQDSPAPGDDPLLADLTATVPKASPDFQARLETLLLEKLAQSNEERTLVMPEQQGLLPPPRTRRRVPPRYMLPLTAAAALVMLVLAGFVAALTINRTPDSGFGAAMQQGTPSPTLPEELVIATQIIQTATAFAQMPTLEPEFAQATGVVQSATAFAQSLDPNYIPPDLAEATRIVATMNASMGTYTPSFDCLQAYIVQSGDTLGSVAQRFNIPPEDIFAVNGLNTQSVVQVGQTLYIPQPLANCPTQTQAVVVTNAPPLTYNLALTAAAVYNNHAPVVVSLRDIARGETFTLDMLTVVYWPIQTKPFETYPWAEALIGNVALADIPRFQPVFESQVTVARAVLPPVEYSAAPIVTATTTPTVTASATPTITLSPTWTATPTASATPSTDSLYQSDTCEPTVIILNSGERLVMTVAAGSTIAAGETIDWGMLTLVPISEGDLTPGMFFCVQDVVGRVTSGEIAPETIITDALFSTIVPPGTVAVAMPVGLNMWVEAGDRVDVIAVLLFDSGIMQAIAPQGAAEASPESVTVMRWVRNALVLEVTENPAPSSTRDPYLLTLALDREQAGTLASLVEDGSPLILVPHTEQRTSIVGIGLRSDITRRRSLCNVINEGTESVMVRSVLEETGTQIGTMNANQQAVVYDQRRVNGELWYFIGLLFENEAYVAGWIPAETVRVEGEACPAVP